MKYTSFIIISCLLLTFSCQKPGIFKANLIDNSNVEAGNNSPDDWRIVNNIYSIGWTGERYRSGDKSLTIQNNNDSTGGSIWVLELNDVSQLRKNKKLKLDVWVMVEDVTSTGFGESEGVFFSVEGLDGGDLWKYTSLGNQLIVGSQNWTLYSLTTDVAIPANTTEVTVRLGLGAYTQGRVWFDDISLYYVN